MVNIRPTKNILLFLLGFGLIFCASAHAVELNGVSLGPTIIDRTVMPGESFEQEFNVQNRTEGTVRLEAYVQDFRVENNQWNKVENPDPRWSPMTWATIVKSPEKLASGEQGKIRVRFDVPKNAEMGEQVTYFNVKFIPVIADQKKDQVAKVTVASEIRSLVYVKVTDAQRNFTLRQAWRVDKAGTGFWHFGKPVFTVAAANTGNVHLEVRGKIDITDMVRNQKTILDVPLFNILPGAEKKIGITWSEAPFIGYFQGKMRLTYDDENFEERKFSFVVVPLLTMAGTVTIFAGGILAVVLYIRKLHKRLAEAEQLRNSNPGL
ncbi:MAG: hypothetical protein K6T65_12865 [Peptococcaceae bacterium]|nr:hypothetical protein [Peptococcaceae bacterium]